jgi:hypothetical protein
MYLLRFYRNRLVQFAVIGGVLYGLTPARESPSHIEIRSERLGALRSAEAARSGGLLTQDKAREVEERALEDEILYREGVRLGLDRNDGIVRQRVAQKVLMLAEETAGATRTPSERELRDYLEKTQSRWQLPERFHLNLLFRHDPAALDSWMRGPRSAAMPPGEPSPVGEELDLDRDRLAQALGAGFVSALAAAPTDTWFGPVASPYGYFLVRIRERAPARPARYEEVRGALIEALQFERRQQASAAYLRRAFARYRVTIDGAPLTRFEPTQRVAYRSVSSGED